jgi:mannosyltransferase OCH1-like enzyme
MLRVLHYRAKMLKGKKLEANNPPLMGEMNGGTRIEENPCHTWLSYRDDEIVRKEVLPEIDTTQIPRLIWMSWVTNNLPSIMREHVDILRATHPNFTVQVCSDDDCRKFIRDYFTEEVLSAFDGLIPGAYKSDFWRYCVLYVFGGIYADIKYYPCDTFNYEELISNKEYWVLDLYFAGIAGIHNGFMCVKPRNSHMLEAIKLVCKIVRTKDYRYSALAVSGPHLLRDVLPKSTPIEMHISERLADNTNIIYMGSRPVLKGYPEYRSEQIQHGSPHYVDLYNNKNVFRGLTIPKMIHQTWATTILPPCLTDTVESLKAANPDWEHRIYDDDASRTFIKEHFPAAVLWAFDTLVPGTFKADLFRYCVLYIYGGVYLDIKYAPVNGFSFNEFWRNGNDVYIYEQPGCVYQGFFMCRPKEQKLRHSIWNVVKNVRNKYYGDCFTCPTGPHMFGGTFKTSEINLTVMPIRYREIDGIGELHFDNSGRVILRHCKGYRTYQHTTYKANGTKYWKDMWAERNIYKLENYPPPV